MNRTRLIIEDTDAELSDGTPIAVSYQVNDLANIADRQSTYSNTIKLPKSFANREIFGHANSVQFTQTQPYDLLTATLEQGGVQIIPNGRISLLRVSDSFECQLTYGLIGFLDKLKKYVYDPLTERLNSVDDVKLADLDWSDVPHFFKNTAAMIASYSGTPAIVWAVVDYGDTVTASAVINDTYLRPGVTFKSIFDRIQRYTGYAFSGPSQYAQGLNDWIPFTEQLLNYEGTEDISIGMSVEKNIPDITALSLLKDYMQRYFLTPVVDNINKTVYFRSFDELYTNIPNARDWTRKFINDSREDSFALSNYAQNNNLLWVEDQEKTGVDGIITINNQNLSVTKDIITSIFASSGKKTGVLGGQTIAQIKLYSTSPLPNFGTDPDVNVKTRVLRLVRLNGTYGFEDTTSTTYTNLGIQSGLFYNWQYYLDNFGQGLLKMLDRCRVVSRNAVLSPLDVKDFDFFTPVYDQNDGRYYYVNQISNFIPGQKVKINLIRL